MGTPTRFPFGVTNRDKSDPLGSYGAPDPTRYTTFFDDFNTYTAAQWTVTAVGAGTTEALTNVRGGALLITSDVGATDGAFLDLLQPTFSFVSGKKLWFKAKFQLSDATDSAAVIGLQVKDTTPLAVSDGVYFIKPTGATALNLVAIKTAGGTTTQLVTQMANATDVEVAYVYDGKQSIRIYLNGVEVAVIPTTNMPSALLTVSFGMQNGAAAAKTMTTNYIFASTER